MKTKGQIEAEISQAVNRFEQEYMGRGPEDTRTYLIDDLVLVRLRGVLTPAEKSLARIDTSPRGRALVKQVRIELLESGRTALEAIIQEITQRPVLSLHTDVSTKTGERVILFTLQAPPTSADPPASPTTSVSVRVCPCLSVPARARPCPPRQTPVLPLAYSLQPA